MGGYEVCRRIDAGDAFRKLRDDLLTAVNDVHVLANNLYSRGLISREQLEHAQLLALTPSERKVKLFDAIEARLRSKHEDLVTLLDVFKGDPLLEIFVNKIQYQFLEERIQICLREYLMNDALYHDKVEHIAENDQSEDAPQKAWGNEGSNEPDESEKKESLLSGVRRGIRKLFGVARDMTASFIKSTLNVLKLDIKIFRKYKKRFDKHTDREQVRWWFEIWGDEKALKALESKWEEVSAESKWRLETCRPVPPQKR